jgi:hypothetical protein
MAILYFFFNFVRHISLSLLNSSGEVGVVRCSNSKNVTAWTSNMSYAIYGVTTVPLVKTETNSLTIELL